MSTVKRLLLVCLAIAIAPAITQLLTGTPLAVEFVMAFLALVAGLIIGLAERFFAGDDIKRMPDLLADRCRLSRDNAELQQALEQLHDAVVTHAVRQRSGKAATDKAGSLLRRLRQHRVIRQAIEE